MSQYHWDNCPPEVQRQVKQFVQALKTILNDNLTGIYLHGSLAMGCFNPQSSDIDILVTTQDPIAPEAARALARLFLESSNSPRPLEVSFLHTKQLDTWQHPMPYDMHYSEDWRSRYQSFLEQTSWDSWTASENYDGDLAAHITITRHRGICLWGQPILQTFPMVPEEDYIQSIVSDFQWANERIAENPVYNVLNACRVLAYLQEGLICSKEEGGVWALDRLPPDLQTSVSTSLRVYRGQDDAPIDPRELDPFTRYMDGQIEYLTGDVK